MTSHDRNQNDQERKPSVLETYGYQTGGTLGRGSYATVKSAYSKHHKNHVAIKIVSMHRAPSDYINKFLPREIETMKILKHPNCISLLQTIQTNNRIYLILELAENGNLREAIGNMGVASEQKAGRWFHQLVDGIDYCHKRGVVHRDLKSDNILLNKEDNIKIADFGFSKANVYGFDGQVHYSDTYCGSLAYACPEILSGTPYDPILADIWSMGIILYFISYGKLPYDDLSLSHLLVSIQRLPEFPDCPPTSDEMKGLICKILVPAQSRASINDILTDYWFQRVDPTTEPASICII